MKQVEKDLKLKLLCLEIASRVELETELDYNMERMFITANRIFNHAHRWGYLDMKSVFKKPEIDMNAGYKNELASQAKNPKRPPLRTVQLKEEETKPAPAPEQPPKTEGNMEPCGRCGELIPKTWMQKHGYKKDGSRCGHNL